MKITILVALQGANCISIDDDHSAKVKLTCDAGQIAQVVKLLTLKGKAFPIVVDTEKAT